eukprot:1820091-Lingulodinium_polyedra.AAC.1
MEPERSPRLFWLYARARRPSRRDDGFTAALRDPLVVAGLAPDGSDLGRGSPAAAWSSAFRPLAGKVVGA